MMIRNHGIKAIVAAGVLGGVLFVGCEAHHQPAMMDVATSAENEKGGAQLWEENCSRCHNFRSPTQYNDAEWQVVMHHMRVRANLTAQEHKKILEFLQAGNR